MLVSSKKNSQKDVFFGILNKEGIKSKWLEQLKGKWKQAKRVLRTTFVWFIAFYQFGNVK